MASPAPPATKAGSIVMMDPAFFTDVAFRTTHTQRHGSQAGLEYDPARMNGLWLHR